MEPLLRVADDLDENHPPPDAQRDQNTVLIVDDELSMRELLGEILEDH